MRVTSNSRSRQRFSRRPDHRVHPAGQGVLDHATGAVGTERVVAHRTRRAGAHRDGQPSYVVRERQRRHERTQRATGLVGVLGCVRPVQVEVDDGVVALGPAGHVGADRRRQLTSGVGQLGVGADRGDQAGRALVEAVVGDDARPVRTVDPALDRAKVVEGVLAVVAPGQHLQHRLPLGESVDQPLGEELHDLLGDERQRLDPFHPVGESAVGGEHGELVPDPGQHVGALGVDLRLVEPAEPDAAGEVPDHGEPQLGRTTEPFQEPARVRSQVPGRHRLGDPAAEQGGGDRHLRRGPLLGEEDPEDRLLQLRAALEIQHAVVTEHLGQPLAEVLRQATALDVEALEVGVEVLARAVHAELGVALLVGGLVATELGEVGEGAEELELVLEDRLPRRPHLLPHREVPRQRLVLGRRRHVEAQHHGGEVAAGPGESLGRRAALGGLRELDRRSGRGHLGGRVLVADLLEAHERRTGLDLAAGGHQQVLDPGPERRVEDRLHLHRLEHDDRGARLHLVADGDGCGHHESRGRRTLHAALVPGDAVGDAVDLDQRGRAVGGGDHVVPLTADHEPPMELVEAVELGLDGRGVAASRRPSPGSATGRCSGSRPGRRCRGA